MRSSNKARSRNRNNSNSNRRSNTANVVNRVFDSNGPEGKVRGTPQQIVDKYQALAQDATLSGDRINAENFLQHSEHYSRLLSESQREINERREAQEAQRQQQQQQQQQKQQKQQQQNKQQNQQPAADANNAQPDIAGDTAELFPGQADNANLVDTPESEQVTSKGKKTAKSEQSKKVKKTAKSTATDKIEKSDQKVELAPPEAENPAKTEKPEAAAE